ncbi:MAG: DUF1566 domain-containing protein [Chloroflexi bacterium]|nr:DUF1566 domain-containing protein [Chloroflexota bacterium]
MRIHKCIPILAIVIASLACSVFQKAIPGTEASPQTQPATEEQSAALQILESITPEIESAPGATSTETPPSPTAEALPADLPYYPIVDTGQVYCYDDSGSSQPCPTQGQPFFGQDAQYSGNAPSYTDNGDGVINDNVTGLMWQKDPGPKMTYAQAVASEESFDLAGYDDWRLPTIKELYSLILFSGVDPSGMQGTDTSGLAPFIDEAFAFEYGDTAAGERIIDSQWATSTKYVSTTMRGDETDFGVNFADGRIKGYPADKLFFVIYVRGNLGYGVNDFVDNQDGTITDNATKLTWTQNDSGVGLVWKDALNYCERLDYAGISNWRLPNIKELHSIVDYTRSPDTTDSAAINPLFNVTPSINEAGQMDYPFFWSSTTHVNQKSGTGAAYISFGRALGYMNGQWMDVHGAGAQRSDPKSGNPTQWPSGRGPQGDAIRIYNYARCVSGGVSDEILTGGDVDPNVGAGTGLPGAGPGQGLPGLTPSIPQGAPSPAAINACAGLSAGAACSFAAPLIGTVNGNCLEVQTQVLSVLACMPDVIP